MNAWSPCDLCFHVDPLFGEKEAFFEDVLCALRLQDGNSCPSKATASHQPACKLRRGNQRPVSEVVASPTRATLHVEGITGSRRSGRGLLTTSEGGRLWGRQWIPLSAENDGVRNYIDELNNSWQGTFTIRWIERTYRRARMLYTRVIHRHCQPPSTGLPGSWSL